VTSPEPETRPNERPGGQFWADLNEDLKDPHFRRAYVAAALEINVIDQAQGWTRGCTDDHLIVYRLDCGHAQLSRHYPEEKDPVGKRTGCDPCGALVRITRVVPTQRGSR